MKKLETLKKQEEPKKLPSARKKADKPWILQRMWESDADYKKYYFGTPLDVAPREWEDSFDKYMSPKHARQQIEKQLRTHFHGRFRIGRSWRIVNKTTGEIYKIDFSDGKVAIEEVPLITTPTAPVEPVKIKFKPGTTHSDMLAPAMKIVDAAEATEYLQDYIAHVKSEELAKNNLAYYAGYYNRETRERVEKLFNCIHPVLGPVAANLTAEEVFNMGVKMGESIKSKVEAESTK